MSWLSKQLKRTTKILDPVGAALRKQTGGSYGDPLNMYQSSPSTNAPYQAQPRNTLTPQPAGPAPQGTKFGANTGGYNYVNNPFMQGQPPQGGGMAAPAIKMTPPGMSGSYGGPPMGGGKGMGGPPPMQTPSVSPDMQNQMARIQALRNFQ